MLATALPDSQIRRETLDWLRQDLEKLKGETDLVSGTLASTASFPHSLRLAYNQGSSLEISAR